MNKELFIKEIKEDELYLEDMIEVPFGSNSSAMIFDTGIVEFNSFNLERFVFNNVDDFANWRFNEDENVVFKYQVYLGERDTDNTKDILEKYKIDEEEDGGMIWSTLKETTNSKRESISFLK